MILPLTKLKSGQKGTVTEILGGQEAKSRLESMGIRIGKKITKINSMFMRGPITVQVGQTQIGIGYGMAAKVMVDLPSGRQG